MLETLTTLDWVVLGLLSLAVARGAFIGLIREGCSLAALAGATLAVRFGADAGAAWLAEVTKGEIGPTAAVWISGIALAIGAAIAIAWVGRLLSRGVRAVGLGWADRFGGGALGAAEGALAAAVVVIAATWVMGDEHPSIAESRSREVYEDVRERVREGEIDLPNVATPPIFEKQRTRESAAP